MLQRSAQVFIAVKLIGALYLVILGVQAIRHRRSLATAMSAAAGSSDGWRALRDGLVVGVTNPKTYICSARSSRSSSTAGPGTSPRRCCCSP